MLKDAVTGEYAAHLVALMLAVAFTGILVFPASSSPSAGGSSRQRAGRD